MTKVVRIHAYGGRRAQHREMTRSARPAPGEVLLDQKGMALHFADTMLREGKYFLKPDLPAVVGLDGAGIVEAVGPGRVTAFKPGDAACYLFALGAYAEKRIIAANR
jgi:NADPH2:quinone reductase